jgi:GAF domain
MSIDSVETVAATVERMMHAAMATMHSQFASIQLLKNETQDRTALLLLGNRGFTAEAAAFWQTVRLESQTTCGEALRAHQRVWVGDVDDYESLAGTEDLATYRQTGITAVQSTPLVTSSGRLVGMISTHWSKPHRPSPGDFHEMDTVARQVANVVQRIAWSDGCTSPQWVRRRGRPPAGRQGERVKDYPQLSMRLPDDVMLKIAALCEATKQPQWRVIADAIASLESGLTAEERELLRSRAWQ